MIEINKIHFMYTASGISVGSGSIRAPLTYGSSVRARVTLGAFMHPLTSQKKQDSFHAINWWIVVKLWDMNPAPVALLNGSAVWDLMDWRPLLIMIWVLGKIREDIN